MTLADLLTAHGHEQRVRGVVSVNNAVRMLKVDLLDQLGGGRDPASITRQELVRLMDRVRDGAPGRAKPRPAASRRSRREGMACSRKGCGAAS